MPADMKQRSAAQRALEVGTALLLAVMAAIVAAEVFCRYILNASLAWSEELSRYLFIWVSFLGAVIALVRGTHIGVDSLVRRLRPPVRAAVEQCVGALILGFSLLLAWQGMALLPATVR
jgi:TRAP-type transport system small permease protein